MFGSEDLTLLAQLSAKGMDRFVYLSGELSENPEAVMHILNLASASRAPVFILWSTEGETVETAMEAWVDVLRLPWGDKSRVAVNRVTMLSEEHPLYVKGRATCMVRLEADFD